MIYKLINKIPGCDFEVTIKWGKKYHRTKSE
jgi:hypothetical protein